MRKQAILNRLWSTSLVLVFLLLFVWQIPGTIGIRYSLIALLLPVSLILFWRCAQPGQIAVNDLLPLIWLMLLTGWMVVVILCWGLEPSLSWGEFRGQWLTALVAACVGMLLGRSALVDPAWHTETLTTVVFWAFLIQVLLHDVLYLAYWANVGEIPYRQAPVLYLPEIVRALWVGRPLAEGFVGHSGDKFSYVNNTLAALVVAELVQRILLNRRCLLIGWPVLLLSLIAMLACGYLLQFRNGNAGMLLLFGFAVFMVLVRKAKYWSLFKLVSVTGLVVVLLVSFGNVLYRSDERWETLAKTVPIAWDTKAHEAWRKVAPYPKLPNGKQVDGSNYERLAWAKEGSILILEYPLGTGYNRNAFGDRIDHKYQMNGIYRGGHSHSGLVDFGIANGLPGLLLWLSFLGTLFYIGWAAFERGQIAPALTLMFVVSGFVSRSIVDSNLRDHMLQQFMFLAMLFTFALPPSAETAGSLDD